MKHGRRHNRLKEKAYIDRKDAQGYGTPYRPIGVEVPTGELTAKPSEATSLADVLGRKAKHALKHVGVDPDAGDDDDES